MEFSGNFVAGNMGTSVINQIHQAGSLPLSELHYGGNFLPPSLVAYANHSAVEHCGMRFECLFDLFRENLFSTRVDRHRASAKHGHLPGAGPLCRVPRDCIALSVGGNDKRLGSFHGVVVVAQRDVSATTEFADAVIPIGNDLEFLVKNDHVAPRSHRWPTGGCLCTFAGIRQTVEPRLG